MSTNDRTAEKNKLVARLLSEGKDLYQVDSELRKAGFKKKAEPSKIGDAVKGVANKVGEKATGVLQAGAEAYVNRGDKSPLQSIADGTLWNDIKGTAFGVGTGLLNVLDRVGGPVSSLDSGMAETIAEPSVIKKPGAFVKGVAQNIGKPMSEQVTPSQKQGKTGLDAFVTDMLVPSTFIGGGLIKGGLKEGAKKIAKGTLLGGAVAEMASHGDGSNAAPLALAGALAPHEWSKVPGNMYSALEREIEALGRKPIQSVQMGSRLKARNTVKPDEWRDVGMDELLASKQEWAPQDLVAAVRAKRPDIGFDTSQAFKEYSTAGDDYAKGAGDGYNVTMLRQKGINFPEGHLSPDTVAHVRTDVVDKRAQIEKKRQEALDYIKAYDGEVMPDSVRIPTENWIKKYDELLANKSDKTSKDYLINEVQSDLHQTAVDKVHPEPPKPTPEELEDWNRLMFGATHPQGFDPRHAKQVAWDNWNEGLTEAEKKERVGYQTPKDKAKADKYHQILDRSVFELSNRPSAARNRQAYMQKLLKKQDAYHYRTSQLPEDWENNVPLTEKATPPKHVQKGIDPLRVREHTIPQRYKPENRGRYMADEWFRSAEPGTEHMSMAELNKKMMEIQRANQYDNIGIGANRPHPTSKDTAWERLLDRQNRPWSNAELPHDTIRGIINMTDNKPQSEAIARKSWPLIMLKKALIDAVNSGADRLGVLDGTGIHRVLQHSQEQAKARPFLDRWNDKELPGQLESFLKSQGIKDATFGAPEEFTHNPGGPLREQYQARFMNLTPAVKALVKAGIPLYVAIAMVEGQDRQ